MVGVGRKTAARVILLRHGATAGSEAGLVSGLGEENISALGEVQISKSAEALLDVPVERVVTSPR